MSETGAFTQVEAIQLPILSKQQTRYLFFGGDMVNSHSGSYPQGGLDTGSPCIRTRPLGFLARCAVTPVTIGVGAAEVEAVPEGMQQLGNDIAFGGGIPYVNESIMLRRYAILPGPEVDQVLLSQENRNLGVVEITELRGMEWAEVVKLDIERFFFPRYPTLPARNGDVAQMVAAKLDEIERALQTARAPEQIKQLHLYRAIGQAMMRGIKQTERHMREVLAESHGSMQLPPTDPFRKAKYDARDLHYLERTGIERMDAFIERQAVEQAKKVGAEQGALADLVRQIPTMLGDQQKAFAAALGEVLEKFAQPAEVKK